MTDCIPLDLLDPSPFEPREEVDALETEGDIIQPLIVRPKGSRFEIIAGHRRLATLRARGAKEAPCRILNLKDEEAALALFGENRDRRDFSDFERGIYFERFIERFDLSEREAASRLGVSHTTISLCLGVVQARGRVVTGVTTMLSGSGLYERVMTTHKLTEVNRLPEERKATTLQAVVENRLSTDETRELVRKIERGNSPDEAANELILQRDEKARAARGTEAARRVSDLQGEGLPFEE